MLRTTVFCLMAAVPGLAFAEPAQTNFPQSAIGAEVHGVDGTVIGRVSAVERDTQGNIVAVEVPGLEPDDAPNSVVSYVASNERGTSRLLVSDRDERPTGATRETRTR
jgi:hypothetical protein